MIAALRQSGSWLTRTHTASSRQIRQRGSLRSKTSASVELCERISLSFNNVGRAATRPPFNADAGGLKDAYPVDEHVDRIATVQGIAAARSTNCKIEHRPRSLPRNPCHSDPT